MTLVIGADRVIFHCAPTWYLVGLKWFLMGSMWTKLTKWPHEKSNQLQGTLWGLNRSFEFTLCLHKGEKEANGTRSSIVVKTN